MPCFGLYQRVRRRRLSLLRRCKMALRIRDNSPRADILLALADLRDSVGAAKVPAGAQSSATMLFSLLSVFYDKMEAHAAAKLDGLAKIVHGEISGYAGLRCLRRVDTQCLQYEKAAASKEVRVSRSGGPSSFSRGRGGGRPRPKKDLSNTKCYICFSLGHMKYDCPEKDKGRGNTSK